MTAKKPKPQQRVEFLLRQRRRISETSWNAIAPMFGDTILVERDAELMAAIAAWRKRRLDDIDQLLRKYGVVDVGALLAELDRAVNNTK